MPLEFSVKLHFLYASIIIGLHTAIMFQAFLSNTKKNYSLLYGLKWLSQFNNHIAQSAWAVEYTDCTSTEWYNGYQGRLANLHEWVRFSLGAQFMRPCATSKQKSLVNYLYRGVRLPPPMSVLYMTLNDLMMRSQECWGFGECGAPFHCHCSQVHSGPVW